MENDLTIASVVDNLLNAREKESVYDFLNLYSEILILIS